MFCRCPEQYRRRYVEKEIIPPGIAAIRGTGVHAGIKENFGQKIESHEDLKKSDIVDAALSGFKAELKGGFSLTPDEQSIGRKKVVGAAMDTTAALSELYADEMAPEYQPRLVEQRVKLELPDSSHDLLGIIDMADDKDIVVDTKTAAKSKSASDAVTSRQLTTYALLHRKHTGRVAKELRLEVLVATKKPKRQTLRTTRGPADFEVLAATMNAVFESIDLGNFPPNTEGWWCSEKWCGYATTCRYFQDRSKDRPTLVQIGGVGHE